MTKKADTWMPLYVGEYLADTTNLNTEQHGAYCLMLMAAWKRGGVLPNDDGQLAAITKLSVGRWKTHKDLLSAFFTPSDMGLVHKRVTQERLKAQAISDKKSKSGSKGAANRWENDGKDGGEMHGNGMADAMANGMANASQTDAPTGVSLPQPLPTPSELFQEPDGSSSTAKPPTLPACPHRRIIELFGERLPTLTQPKPEFWDGKPADALRTRWKWLLTHSRTDGTRYAETEAEAIDWFGRFFDYVSASDFLMARTGDFKCTLQWLVKAENFAKVVQGNYVNGGAR